MSKKSHNIGQLDLFNASGEALFPVEEIQIIQITQATTTKLQTNLNQEPDFYYIPAERDPDFYPEELFLGNEELPNDTAEPENIPELTAVDIPEDQENNEIDPKLLEEYYNPVTQVETKPEENKIEAMPEETELPDSMPFVLYPTYYVNTQKTRELYSLHESVKFYLALVDSNNISLKALLEDKLEDYFKKEFRWDGDIAGLRTYVSDATRIQDDRGGNFLIHLDGSAEFLGMALFSGKEEAYKIVENISKGLGGKDPDNLVKVAFEKKYIDAFIERINKKTQLDYFLENIKDVCDVFKNIIANFERSNTVSEFYHSIQDNQHHNRKNYEWLFKTLKSCSENLQGFDTYEKIQFEERFEKQYPTAEYDMVQIFRDILYHNSQRKVNTVLGCDHLVPMFASYKYRYQGAKNLISTFKKNTIRKYLDIHCWIKTPWGSDARIKMLEKKDRNDRDTIMKITSGMESEFQKPGKRNNTLKQLEEGPLGIKWNEEETRQEVQELFGEKSTREHTGYNSIPHISLGNAGNLIAAEHNAAEHQRQEAIENKTFEDLCRELEDLLYQENMDQRFSINMRDKTLYDEINKESLELSVIFNGEDDIPNPKDFRKLDILGRASERNFESNENIDTSKTEDLHNQTTQNTSAIKDIIIEDSLDAKTNQLKNLLEDELKSYNFYINTQRQTVSHDDVTSQHLPLEKIFAVDIKVWREIILEWWKNSEIWDLPF